MVVYLVAAYGAARINDFVETEQPTWRKLIALPFVPAYIVGLILLFCLLPAFWWLYPERHAHELDVEGTDEEMREWAEYKALLSRKPFRRRLAEKIGLVPETGPSG